MSHFEEPRRDPAAVLRATAELLEENPELRVGQVIATATYRLRGDCDSFYVEDPALAQALLDIAEEYRRRRSSP